MECPIERIFPKTLRDKFPWAMSVPQAWTFAPVGGAEATLADDIDSGDEPGGHDDDDDEDVPLSKLKAVKPKAAAKPAKAEKARVKAAAASPRKRVLSEDFDEEDSD